MNFSNDNNSQNQESNTMGDIDNPNNMIIIPPLPGKRRKRSSIGTTGSPWPLLAVVLQYAFDYNVTMHIV